MAMTTSQVLALLARHESRNITFVEPDGSWPIVWSRARGVYVEDPEGRRYLDMTAAFGVAAAGHANPAVLRALRSQSEQLLHAMGDVHPHEGKALLARELSDRTFARWTAGSPQPQTGKVLFCNSGFEAVEAALKTAHLATDRTDILAFEGGYHGVGYGTLQATHRTHFRGPFLGQLKSISHFAPFPEEGTRGALASAQRAIEAIFTKRRIGAVVLEPIQARGGIRVPPASFLPWLRRVCDAHGAVLILDEIYTGFGRTGAWFACEHTGVIPDLICLGKALTGGFPLSACVGHSALMDKAWPATFGEAIHTSTFLGHPLGCAMALAHLREITRRKLPDNARELGPWLLETLTSALPRRKGLRTRGVGRGLMLGIEVCDTRGKPATATVIQWMKSALHRGLIVLPEGEHSHILSLTPPLTLTRAQAHRAIQILVETFPESA